MIESPVELAIVAPVLDHATGMSDRGPIAGEERSHLGEAEPTDHMSEIHGHLAGEGRPRRAAGGGAQIVDVHLHNIILDVPTESAYIEGQRENPNDQISPFR